MLQDIASSSSVKLSQELRELDTNFRDRHRFLLKVLTAKTLKISGTSELHNLVMRLDFNNFYQTNDEIH